MAFPENKPIEFPQNPLGTVITGIVKIDLRQESDKGFDFIKGVGAAWTAVLEGSVSGQNWTTVDALAASAQGAIAGHYNLVRLRVTSGGALGTNNSLTVSGKVL